MPARFYVKESTGYPVGKIRSEARTGGTTREITEVLVLDRDYCHRVAWSSLWKWKRYSHARLPALRDEAKRLCREWNAEDRADDAA